MRTTFRTLTFLVISVLFRCEAASSQTVSFAWDESSSTPVTGYAVTIDGVRTDYGLTPLNSSSACGCSIVLPFSGGNHTLKVSAYNSSGEAWSSPLMVAPTAGAGGPYAGRTGTALVVDGSGSKDPAGTIMTYDWNWGDGTGGIGSSPAASHLYATSGAFTLTLKVTDNGGATASANATATITAAPTSGPTAILTSPGSATVLTYPASTTLAATASAGSGTIANVAFYAGSSLIGTDTTAPYSVSWTNIAAGAYSVTAVATDSGGLSTRSAAVAITVTAASSSTPYLGTPVAIPGTVEAENFDNGADGTAYHDTTSGNTGGAYRSTNVDIQANSAAGGFNLGWVAAGEWLNYAVNVASAGTYTVNFRVAAGAQGGTFHLQGNGSNLTGPLTVPNTGGWQTWGNVSKTVTLGAGQQTLCLVMDAVGASGIGNFDSMQFVAATTSSAAYLGTPVAIPGTVQAENFDNGADGVAYHDTTSGNSGGAYRSTNVDIQPNSTGGFNVGWVTAGEWLNYAVNVAGAGTYTVNFRVAAAAQGGTFHLEANGKDLTGSLTVPNTGAWQTWTNVSGTVILGAGAQTLHLVMDTNGSNGIGNFDSIQFVATP